jgi:hypothetical protein
LDSESNLLALFRAPLLVGRRGTEGGIECDIRFVFAGGSRLDVASAFAFGMRARTPPALAARDLVQWIIDFTRSKCFGGIDPLSAFPPMRSAAVKDFLRTRLRKAILGFSLTEMLI